LIMRSNRRVRTLVLLTISVMCCQVPGYPQTATPSAPPTPLPAKPARPITPVRSGSVVAGNRQTAPQVVTILHRLNGLKMFRLLLRSHGELRGIAGLDDAFKMTDEVHTNVIAGLALDDGETIVAWLPDAEVEVAPPPSPFAPVSPPPPKAPSPSVKTQTPRASRIGSRAPAGIGAPNFFERPDLTVIARDGKRLNASYVGLDGVTGLSILKVNDKNLPRAIETNEGSVAIGQHVRLFGPEPVPKLETLGGGTVYARIGETDGTVVELTRSPSGAISRITIGSTQLSAANIGGVVVNEAGETVGIVDAIENRRASLVPAVMVQTAAKRVLDRQASVPKPWLGVWGEPVVKLGLDQIVLKGWEREGAKMLAEARRGIMLTSVAPGSPAAVAELRPGDVILRVNQEEVRTADDFSWLLQEVGPGRSVNFMIARPGNLSPEAVDITLTESPEPVFGPKVPEGQTGTAWGPGTAAGLPLLNSISGSLFAQGIETIALKPRAAAQFGGNGGLLVVFVRPSTPAFKAGLRSGDLIEAIDGKLVSLTTLPGHLSSANGSSHSFSVVRNKERLVIKVRSSN
jgi:S1-C subfamily serine protease